MRWPSDVEGIEDGEEMGVQGGMYVDVMRMT
jgi:hypothetical protein